MRKPIIGDVVLCCPGHHRPMRPAIVVNVYEGGLTVALSVQWLASDGNKQSPEFFSYEIPSGSELQAEAWCHREDLFQPDRNRKNGGKKGT